jgi:hypothetical protein
MKAQWHHPSVVNRSDIRTPRPWWQLFVVACTAVVLCAGCATTPPRQGPQTVQEFVGQPRPGNGILGK